MSDMGFEHALDALKNGHRVSRSGWSGSGMWLVMVWPDDDCLRPPGPAYTVVGLSGVSGPCLPWIGMKTADNCFVPWLCSQADMAATDWGIA